MAGISYVVTAPLIVVKVPGAQGGEAYIKRDRILPASVRTTEIERLLALGLIEPDPVSVAAAAAAELAAEQAEAARSAQEAKKPTPGK